MEPPKTNPWKTDTEKNAHVEIDNEKRIIHYKAKDGSLELRGDQSVSAKRIFVYLASKRTNRWFINNYYENKNNTNAVPWNDNEKEIWNFIEFITEKCDNANSPLSIRQLVKDYNRHFEISRSFGCIYERLKTYCREIQSIDFMDTHTKVKQLFALSATLDSICLNKLGLDAVVEVDNMNRITKYTANNGGLTLHGNHRTSEKTKFTLKKKNDRQTGNLMVPSNGADYFDNEDCSSTERTHSSEGIEMREDEEIYSEITENAVTMTRSKRRHVDSDFSHNPTNFSSSGPPMNTDPSSSKPAKKRKITVQEEQASSSSRLIPFPSIPTGSGEGMKSQDDPETGGISLDYHEPRIPEMNDYDYYIDNRLGELGSPTAEAHNFNKDSQNADNRPDAVAPEPNREEEILQNDKNCSRPTIKVEPEEIIIIENPTEVVKSMTSHNSKIKFFEAMKSLILFLDTPFLSDLQSKIYQKIRMLKRSNEVVLQNNELIPALEFMIARITNHSTNNLPKSVESVSLSHFLCHLKAAVLSSRLLGLDSLMEKIKEHNKNLDLQIKIIPVETLASVLQTTIDLIGF